MNNCEKRIKTLEERVELLKGVKLPRKDRKLKTIHILNGNGEKELGVEYEDN